eukprot:gene5252-8016_t
MSRAATFALLAAAAAAMTCPDYAAMAPPPLPPQTRAWFRGFGSMLLSKAHSNHLVVDQLVNASTTATMVGTFEYGILLTNLKEEEIRVFIFGTGMAQWESLGTYKTNRDGKVFVDVTKPVGEYTIAMVVAGDLTTVFGYLTVIEPGLQAVLFDIDGTLTKNDVESALDLFGVKKADAYDYAKDVVLAYKQKAYKVVYLTARPYWFSEETREWMEYMQLPPGHLHHKATGNLLDSNTEAFKTEYIAYLLAAGLDIVRVYGNADTDIAAYENNKMPKDDTYIIGSNAGEKGTQPVVDDYGLHLIESNTGSVLSLTL